MDDSDTTTSTPTKATHVVHTSSSNEITPPSSPEEPTASPLTTNTPHPATTTIPKLNLEAPPPTTAADDRIPTLPSETTPPTSPGDDRPIFSARESPRATVAAEVLGALAPQIDATKYDVLGLPSPRDSKAHSLRVSTVVVSPVDSPRSTANPDQPTPTPTTTTAAPAADAKTPRASSGGLFRSDESFVDEEDDLLQVPVGTTNGDIVSAMAEGDGLTSAEFSDEAAALDWSAECLLLTHEPLRRDMLEMQRALQPRYMGDFPEGWRVRSFFAFFEGWCSLVAQALRVQVEVHHDWLLSAVPEPPEGLRRKLLEDARAVERAMSAVSSFEGRIHDELAGAADMITAEPWSERTEELRMEVDRLCTLLRAQLTYVERTFPPLLRAFWGPVAPPHLVKRSLDAATRAMTGTHRHGGAQPRLLPWVLFYLVRRDAARARRLAGQLPFSTRMRLATGYDAAYGKHLATLRAILKDDPPRHIKRGSSRMSSGKPSLKAPQGSQPAEQHDVAASEIPRSDEMVLREKRRKQATVGAILAAANADRERSNSRLSSAQAELAKSTKPLHVYKGDDFRWVDRLRVPAGFDVWRRVGMQKPQTPRRM